MRRRRITCKGKNKVERRIMKEKDGGKKKRKNKIIGRGGGRIKRRNVFYLYLSLFCVMLQPRVEER